jgi:hypothetical protein
MSNKYYQAVNNKPIWWDFRKGDTIKLVYNTIKIRGIMSYSNFDTLETDPYICGNSFQYGIQSLDYKKVDYKIVNVKTVLTEKKEDFLNSDSM